MVTFAATTIFKRYWRWSIIRRHGLIIIVALELIDRKKNFYHLKQERVDQ